MSDLLQPGLHLDADQLGAFAEGALPAHERVSALAHLAVCPACREVLALAMPEVVPAPAKLGWFTGWQWGLPGAAALAAILMVAVVLRRPHAGPGVVVVPVVETARAVAPAPLPAPVAKAPRLGAVVPPPPKAAIVLGQEKVVAPANSLGGTLDGQLIQDLPVEGRSSAFLGQAARAGAIHGDAYGAAANGAVLGGMAGGTGQGVVSQGRVAGPSQQSQMAAAPMAPAMAPQMAAAPPPAPVTSMDAFAADASEMAAISLAAPRMRVALPSGKGIASTVAANGATLAVDTAGALFVSSDGGGHWKAVKAVWKGKAVSVGFVVPPAPPKPVMVAPNYTLRMTAGTAGIAGTVQDATGAVVPGAAVRVSGGSSRVVKADGAGRYRIQGLPPGPYAVEASAPGFLTQRVMVTLAAGQVDQENLKLAVGSQAETVTVETAGSVVETQTVPSRAGVPVFSLVAADGGRWVSADGFVWVPGL